MCGFAALLNGLIPSWLKPVLRTLKPAADDLPFTEDVKKFTRWRIGLVLALAFVRLSAMARKGFPNESR